MAERSADPPVPRGHLSREIRDELTQLFTGRVSLADGVLPPLAFVIVNALFGLVPAALVGIGSAVSIVLFRLSRRKPLRFAVAGLGGTLVAVLVAIRSGNSSSYFLPGLVTGTLTTLAIFASIVARRPFVAWTSWLTRGWPIGWYWHPRVRPAYVRASWLWGVFFGVRTGIQWWLFSRDATTALGLARVFTGWPALLLLLIATYVLGRRWLRTLGGPSVEEFEASAPPPWKGQPVGF